MAQQWAQAFDLPLRIQFGDDLGARMDNALQDQLARGAEYALVMGCDCPLLDGDYLGWVAEHAASSDVIIAPAEDGVTALSVWRQGNQRFLRYAMGF